MSIRKLQNGERIVGTMVRFIRNPGLVQIANAAGLDFIMYDMEHGALSLEDFSDAAKLAGLLDLSILVRVPELSKAWVSRVLDLGADGVMVPMISSGEEARKLVEWAKYSPIGKRGLSTIGEHTGMVKSPLSASGFMAEQNKKILVIAQIESAEAIASIEQIASVPGLDALLIGPNDLSVSLGCPGDLLGDLVHEAIAKVADAAEKYGKIFSMHAGDELLQRWLGRNMSLVMNDMDMHLLHDAFRKIPERYSL